MKNVSLLAAATALTLLAPAVGGAQSVDDLNIQFHGYATQAFVKTSQNNILTTDSSGGSAAWTEAVVNLSSTPTPQLRVAVQGRYALIGTVGNSITLDYAMADYKVSERAGFRFGKVKVPNALFNETQDIDPSYLWSLLPSSVYPILSRNSSLSLFGGVGYGSVAISDRLGKLDYRIFGGLTVLASNDGYFIPFTAQGISVPNGANVPNFGGELRWRTPVRGLLFGASDKRQSKTTGALLLGGALPGSETEKPFNWPDYFAQYEHGRFMVAGEFARLDPSISISFQQGPNFTHPVDTRGWYAMATYKITDKLSAGLYDSQLIDHASVLGPARFSKDWALSARYDFGQYLYAKVEQHFIDGTAVGYSGANNTGGLKPDTRLSIIKLGVSF